MEELKTFGIKKSPLRRVMKGLVFLLDLAQFRPTHWREDYILVVLRKSQQEKSFAKRRPSWLYMEKNKEDI